MISLKRTGSGDPHFVKLVALLDEDLRVRDGEEHTFYAAFNKIANINNVVICYVDDVPAGCGAFKEYDQVKAEIKRMYVLPSYRRNGLAQSVLNELENWASALNYSACILETGKNQPEAIGLYQKAGYAIIPNYGQYQNAENSICFEKDLG